MENLKKVLPSGAELEITKADFPVGHRLFKEVLKEIEDVDLGEGTVQKLAFRLIASENIERALWPCMERATYNKAKVNPDLFNNEKAQADFVLIQKEVLVYNLGPFFVSLASVLVGLGAAVTGFQKSK